MCSNTIIYSKLLKRNNNFKTGPLLKIDSIKLYLPCPSSLKTNSRFSVSFSFLPRLRFLPPFPGGKKKQSKFLPKLSKLMLPKILASVLQQLTYLYSSA